MRLSCMKDDPGYNGAAALWATIFLDDQPLDLCVTADEELGRVWRYVRDEQGKLLLEPQSREPMVELTSGRVRIELGGLRPGLQVPYPEGAA